MNAKLSLGQRKGDGVKEKGTLYFKGKPECPLIGSLSPYWFPPNALPASVTPTNVVAANCRSELIEYFDDKFSLMYRPSR